jgi:hypothetical protein
LSSGRTSAKTLVDAELGGDGLGHLTRVARDHRHLDPQLVDGIANSVAADEAPAGSIRATVVTAIRIVTTDVMVFAGVDLDTAVEAVRAGILEHRVQEPPPAQRGIRGWLKALFRD